MSNETFVTFAYGSNMLSARLRNRVSTATVIGAGQLRGYSLKWDKRSRRDGSGKCDAQFTGSEADSVWGVLFRVETSQKLLLDEAEGLHQGYEEKEVHIQTGEGSVKAQLYYATDKDVSCRPFNWYKAFVVAGAREHNLPPDYISLLEAEVSVLDPNQRRAAENAKILSGG